MTPLDLLAAALEARADLRVGAVSTVTFVPAVRLPVCGACRKCCASRDEMRASWYVLAGIIGAPAGKRCFEIFACSRRCLLQSIAYADEMRWPTGTLMAPITEPPPPEDESRWGA